MKNHSGWSVELGRIAAMVAGILLVGLLTQAWLWVVVIAFSFYVFYHYWQLRQLNKWLKSGLKDHHAPDGNGIWEVIVQRLYRYHRVERSHKRRMKEALSQFNDIVSTLPYATLVLNEDWQIKWSNRIAEGLLGIRKTHDRGQMITNLIRDPAFHKKLMSAEDDKRFELLSPVDAQKILLVRVIRFGCDQNLMIARDISYRAAIQKNRKLFVANASHELRTPLSVISGYLEILDSEPDMPSIAQEAIKSSMEQSQRMCSIIEDMLTLSTLENTELQGDEGTCLNIANKLEKFVHNLSESGKLEHHHIHIDCQADLSLKAVDVEVESVFMNLIGNAIKHTPDGSSIDVKWQCDEHGNPCFMVSDNGRGISQEHLSHLSERFYRVDEGRDRRTGGTGLGLSIVKHVMERHGGYLKIHSVLGEGSSFYACFPADRICSLSVGSLSGD